MATSDKWTDYGKKVKATIKELHKEPFILSGIQGEQASAQATVVINGAKEETDVKLIDVAVWMEFGTSDGRVPERSVIRATYDIKREAWRQVTDHLMKAVIAGKMDLKTAMNRIGLMQVSDYKSRIAEGVRPWNALSTIQAKSRNGVWGNMPLINSGQYLESFTYVLKNADSQIRH